MVSRIAHVVRRRALFLSATLAVASLLIATPAVWAQSAGSTIHGTVKDESGGAMPGVTVTLKSPALQVPQLAVVNVLPTTLPFASRTSTVTFASNTFAVPETVTGLVTWSSADGLSTTNAGRRSA